MHESKCGLQISKTVVMLSNTHLSHMYWSRVAIIKPDPMEDLGGVFTIAPHQIPQVGAVFRLLSVSELDTVPPSYKFAPQVHI